MLILLGRYVGVVGEAERERPVVGGGRGLLTCCLGAQWACGKPRRHPPDFPVLGPQFKRRVQESTQVLRELEISLRTNHIG